MNQINPRVAQTTHYGDHASYHEVAPEQPAEFWERLYGEAGPVWSGKVNRTLAETVTGFAPGRSLDLGCGEGGDVLWLASQGWQATGIDLSQNAIARAREAASAKALHAQFIAADLAEWAQDPVSIDGGGDGFELITASFFQSPVELPRETILRAAARRVVSGGHLVLLSHAASPPWADGLRYRQNEMPSPESELALLGLDPEGWHVFAEIRTRDVTGPPGTDYAGRPMQLDDTLVVALRR